MTTFEQAIVSVSKLTQAQIAATARRMHGEIMRSEPRPVNFVRHVDGREGVPEEQVRPDGIIVYDYNRLDVIAKDALRLLRENSPVKSGEYRDAHSLYLNLSPVADLTAWKPGDEISITNTVPYARVIELGRRGSTAIRLSVQPHIYERVAKALRRTYAGAADIQFTFRAVMGGGQVNQLTRPAGMRAHNKAEVRWPTITINPAGSFYRRGGVR